MSREELHQLHVAWMRYVNKDANDFFTVFVLKAMVKSAGEDQATVHESFLQARSEAIDKTIVGNRDRSAKSTDDYLEDVCRRVAVSEKQ